MRDDVPVALGGGLLLLDVHVDAVINWWACCYEVIWDRPIRHQEEEIVWGRFMSEAELTAQLDRLPFVPDGLVAFRRYLDESDL